MWKIWVLLLFVASSLGDWMLHTPGGGPLEERCPCMVKSLCPREFGRSAADILHLGNLPICMDSREIRCCGVSKSMIMIVQSKDVHVKEIEMKNDTTDEGIPGTEHNSVGKTGYRLPNTEEIKIQNMTVERKSKETANKTLDHDSDYKERGINNKTLVNLNVTNKNHFRIRIADRLRNNTKFSYTENKRRNITENHIGLGNVNKTYIHMQTKSNKIKSIPVIANKNISTENNSLTWLNQVVNNVINHDINYTHTPDIYVDEMWLDVTVTEKKITNCDSNTTCVIQKHKTNATNTYIENDENVPDNEFAESNVLHSFKHFPPKQNETSMLHNIFTTMQNDISNVNVTNLTTSNVIQFSHANRSENLPIMQNESGVHMNNTNTLQISDNDGSEYNASQTTEAVDNINRNQKLKPLTTNKTGLKIENMHLTKNISNGLSVNPTHTLNTRNETHNQKINGPSNLFIVYPSKYGQNDTLSRITNRENRSIIYVFPEIMSQNTNNSHKHIEVAAHRKQDEQHKNSTIKIQNVDLNTDSRNTARVTENFITTENYNLSAGEQPKAGNRTNFKITVPSYENKTKLANIKICGNVTKNVNNKSCDNQISSQLIANETDSLNTTLDDSKIATFELEGVNTQNKGNYSLKTKYNNTDYKIVEEDEVELSQLEKRDVLKYTADEIIQFQKKYDIYNVAPQINHSLHKDNQYSEHYTKLNPVIQRIPVGKINVVHTENTDKEKQIRNKEDEGSNYSDLRDETTNKEEEEVDEEQEYYRIQILKQNIELLKLHPEQRLNETANSNVAVSNVKPDVYRGRFVRKRNSMTDTKNAKDVDYKNVQETHNKTANNYNTAFSSQIKCSTNFCSDIGATGKLNISQAEIIKTKQNIISIEKPYEKGNIAALPLTNFRNKFRRAAGNKTNLNQRDQNSNNYESKTNKFFKKIGNETNKRVENSKTANLSNQITTSTTNGCQEKNMDVKHQKTTENNEREISDNFTDNNYLIYIINPLYYLPYQNSEYIFNEKTDNLNKVRETEIKNSSTVENIADIESETESFLEIPSQDSLTNSSQIITLSSQNYDPLLYLPYENSTLNFNTEVS